MVKIDSKEEFIEKIRSLDEKLNNIRVSSVEINKAERVISYEFICPNFIDDFLKNKIADVVYQVTPEIFKSVEIKVKKIVSDETLINNEIYKFLSSEYPSISIFLKETDISSSVFGESVKYNIRFTEEGAEYFKKSGAILKLNEYLSKKFCSDFIGDTVIKEESEVKSLLNDEVYEGVLQKIEHRTIKVNNVTVIDDLSLGDTAQYIEDAVSGNVTISGTVTEVYEKETKNGKPFFIFHLDDTTGRQSGVYFSKKTTYEKIKAIKEGDAIICRGNIGEYNGRQSFTIDKINLCEFPIDFVKKEKYKKQAPKEYSLIFPTEADTFKVKSVFDEEEKLPSSLTEKEYVVFDFETTGIDYLNNGITEIGAVKIKNGKIVEQFTTLIKPNYQIPAKITELTGISEEMVKNSPKIENVIPDFMKFIENATLVGHNALEFDIKFLKRFAGVEEYEIKNEVIDTLNLSRELLPNLSRFDLHTLASYFNIVFHHHRALSDSYATAEVFIELMKLKG